MITRIKPKILITSILLILPLHFPIGCHTPPDGDTVFNVFCVTHFPTHHKTQYLARSQMFRDGLSIFTLSSLISFAVILRRASMFTESS